MRTLVSWSSGKDSAWMLHVLRTGGSHEVVGLLTTLDGSQGRVSMHGVREELLDAQAEALGLPLVKVRLPWPCPNGQYASAMRAVMDQALREGIEAIAFGDLQLEDVRRYREQNLAGTGIEPLFPLWGRSTGELAREMVAALEARVTCVDPRRLDASFAGRSYDAAFLADLPPGADPCGENGEFHTFVHGGPMFARPLSVEPGAVFERDGFVLADLLRAGGASQRVPAPIAPAQRPWPNVQPNPNAPQ